MAVFKNNFIKGLVILSLFGFRPLTSITQTTIIDKVHHMQV